MKLLQRCFFAFILMGCTLILKASVEPVVSIRSQRGLSFSVHLKDMNNETFEIQLSDQFGFVLIDEKIEDQDDYLKLYNLKKLATGNYKMKIENERKIILQPIRIDQERKSIEVSAKKEIYKPAIKFNYPNLDLNMIYFEDGAVGLRIKDKKGYVLHKDALFLNGSITKRFSVTALPAGDYIFEINTVNYTYEQAFSIDSNTANSKLGFKPVLLDE